MNHKLVFHSANETEVLGFKVARCNEENFDESALLQQVFEGEYDLCRLKIPAEDEMASMKLHQTGLPFFFSGSIRRYKTPISKKPSGDFLHPEMSYEIYDGSQDELLMIMLKGTWGDYPLGYYRTPYISELVNKEIEIKSVFNFYKKNNLNTLHPNNSIVFMNDRGNYVGFFALNKINGGLESHIGGILEPYRKDGYFLDMLRYIKNYCVDYGLKHFAFGARNENAYVQKIFQDVGFKSIGSENVFHITSLLSLSQIEKQIFHPKKMDDKQIFSLFEKYISKMDFNYSIKSISISKIARDYSFKDIRIEFSLPILTKKEFLSVAKILDNENQLYKCFYINGIII